MSETEKRLNKLRVSTFSGTTYIKYVLFLFIFLQKMVIKAIHNLLYGLKVLKFALMMIQSIHSFKSSLLFFQNITSSFC
jgi:hypothetical protein